MGVQKPRSISEADVFKEWPISLFWMGKKHGEEQGDGLSQVEWNRIMEYLYGIPKSVGLQNWFVWWFCYGWWYFNFCFVSPSVMNLGVTCSDVLVRNMVQAAVWKMEWRTANTSQTDQSGSCCNILCKGRLGPVLGCRGGIGKIFWVFKICIFKIL